MHVHRTQTTVAHIYDSRTAAGTGNDNDEDDEDSKKKKASFPKVIVTGRCGHALLFEFFERQLPRLEDIEVTKVCSPVVPHGHVVARVRARAVVAPLARLKVCVQFHEGERLRLVPAWHDRVFVTAARQPAAPGNAGPNANASSGTHLR
jgi:hypothetical protein